MTTIPETNKKVAKKISDDEIGSVLSEFASAMLCKTSYPETERDRIYRDILPKFVGYKTLTEEEEKDHLIKILYLFGLDTQVPLWESVGNELGPLAVDFSKGLVREYDCKTPSEKALAQIVANAYVRVMEYSHTMEQCRNIKEANDQVSRHYSVMSKELDRANRQFITALTTLKQMKAPSIEINVTAKTAFVAENQQFNVNKNNNENIDPK
jgi:hypothetical protein